MSLVLRFTSSANANGLKASAFARSTQGLGLFFNFKQTVTVANDHASFSTITAPGEFAFTLESGAGTRWRSGRQVLNVAKTDTFMILPAPPLTFTAAQMNAMLPATPFTKSSATFTSLSLMLGTGTITVNGIASYASPFGPIPVTIAYVFSLIAVTEPANMSASGFVSPAIDVHTISIGVTPRSGGTFGGLANFFIGILIGLMSSTIKTTVQNAVQKVIDDAVAKALATSGAPPSTIATAESVTITPEAVTVIAYAGFSMEQACPSSGSSGSVKLRSRDQLVHLREIRNRLLPRSPRGAAYLSVFEAFSSELAVLLLNNDRLLRAADLIVTLSLRDFPLEDPARGRVSRELADAIVKTMTLMEKTASPELKLTLTALRTEVYDFVDRPAAEVLDESFRELAPAQLEKSPSLPSPRSKAKRRGA